ncbi:myosin-17-like [Dorcoceras hygrometricum]|uniref:Myosin-17-like n=2 Tax=Dorcoceras hygrometricum TaxID=472368 RepID=A0A2Z7BR01_9LAMI|nr:myosin-17-like [Dorcoceras hygrometricum]
MSLFDLQDLCIAIGSIATLDLPMVVDLIGIYGLKGPCYTITEEHKANQIALEASHMTIAGITEIGLSMSKKIEKMKAKKQQAIESHVVCIKKFQARIQAAEDSMQAQHLIIEALVEEKDSLLQTIQGLQEANGAPAPFDDEWEEEPEEHPGEEEIEDIPMGEGEIDDE